MALLALDGVNMDEPQRPTLNSVGAFMYVAQQVPEAKAILDKLGAKQLVQLDTDGAGAQPTMPTVLDAWGRPIRFVHPKGDGLILGDATQTGNAFDAARRVEAWLGTPISTPQIERRYIYSDIRRSDRGPTDDTAGDGDGGKAIGSRPYFYSAGEDGLVGYGLRDGVWVNYNADNVYLSEPTFSKAPQ
jgi:hypothetical protein